MNIKKGEKFGYWTVIGQSSKPYYYTCKCICGNVKDVYKSSLVLGKSKSCGCKGYKKIINSNYLRSDRKILGKNFGRLSPIKRISSSGNSKYLCKCDCGNKIIVKGSLLLNGRTNSCGCLKSEISRKSMTVIQEAGVEKLRKGQIDGTNKYSLTQKISKNNSTGAKGISFTKNGNYRVYINLRGRQIHIGVFATLEEAIKKRKEAEIKYFKPILDKK